MCYLTKSHSFKITFYFRTFFPRPDMIRLFIFRRRSIPRVIVEEGSSVSSPGKDDDENGAYLSVWHKIA